MTLFCPFRFPRNIASILCQKLSPSLTRGVAISEIATPWFDKMSKPGKLHLNLFFFEISLKKITLLTNKLKEIRFKNFRRQSTKGNIPTPNLEACATDPGTFHDGRG